MDWATLLFSFRGRINRGKYWLTVVINMLVWGAYCTVGLLVVGSSNPDDFDKLSTPVTVGFILVAMVLVAAAIWSALAVAIKRLHDRNRSAWWVVLFYVGPGLISSAPAAAIGEGASLVFGLIAVALSIWAFVEIACLPGTDGSNRFGPDPTPTPAAPTHT